VRHDKYSFSMYSKIREPSNDICYAMQVWCLPWTSSMYEHVEKLVNPHMIFVMRCRLEGCGAKVHHPMRCRLEGCGAYQSSSARAWWSSKESRPDASWKAQHVCMYMYLYVHVNESCYIHMCVSAHRYTCRSALIHRDIIYMDACNNILLDACDNILLDACNNIHMNACTPACIPRCQDHSYTSQIMCVYTYVYINTQP
jgi:hypothetical protein